MNVLTLPTQDPAPDESALWQVVENARGPFGGRLRLPVPRVVRTESCKPYLVISAELCPPDTRCDFLHDGEVGIGIMLHKRGRYTVGKYNATNARFINLPTALHHLIPMGTCRITMTAKGGVWSFNTKNLKPLTLTWE